MKKILYIFLFFFGLVSCSGWLDIIPEGQMPEKKLFEKGAGYRSLLNSLYNAMGSPALYGKNLQFGFVDCLSQQYKTRVPDWQLSDETIREAGEFNYESGVLQKTIVEIWLSAYNVIANANELLQNIEPESESKFELGKAEKNLIRGEALAVRALMHFDILRLFAPALINDDKGLYCPYIDKHPGIHGLRLGVKDYIERVIGDLEKAKELTVEFDTTALGRSVVATGKARFFNELPSDMEGGINTGALDGFFLGRGYRLNYYSIHALLARVYQWAGNREKAFDYARKTLEFRVKSNGGSIYPVFSHEDFGGFAWNDDFESKTDIKVVSNLIFAVYNARSYEKNGLQYYFNKLPNKFGKNNWLQINIDEQEIFTTVDGKDEYQKDCRGEKLIYKVEGYYPLPGKWYLSDNIKIRDENANILPVIRATEMRYIMAEEYARQGKFQEAYGILNEIRCNRGLRDEDLTVKSSYTDFEKDMIRDAQREWIAEGQLFYLYKRLNAKVKIRNEIRSLVKLEAVLPAPVNQIQ